MPERIEIATVAADYDAFAVLVREYWAWLEVRYVDLPGFNDSIGGHQALDVELDSLSTICGPPDGRVLLAYRGDLVIGAVAKKDLRDGSSEMKRLFVSERWAPGVCWSAHWSMQRMPTGSGSCGSTPASRTPRRFRCTSRWGVGSARRISSIRPSSWRT